MVFPVVMDGCESWTIKKAERLPKILTKLFISETSSLDLAMLSSTESWCWGQLDWWF